MSRPRKHNRHLPPCVYQKHGAYWLVKAGKWTRIGGTLSEALAEYARHHEAPRGAMPTLIWRVIEQVSPRLAPATVSQYRTAAARLADILAEFSPEQVRPKDVAKIKLSLAETPNMANRILSVLRIVMQHAVEWQLIDSNPCIGIKRHAERGRRRYLGDAELADIHAHAGPRLRVIIELLCLTGQRVTDVLRIRHADLTDEGIRFQQQKTDSRLVVAWTPELRATVERAKALRGNVLALTLLHNRRGKPPDYRTVQAQWAKACQAAGVQDAQLRDLRAKALTDARKQGLDATALAGHASAAMTETYIRQRAVPVVSGPSFGQVFDKQPGNA